jgi:hypothetical protein
VRYTGNFTRLLTWLCSKSTPALIKVLRQYDIVHLFCDVLPNRTIADSTGSKVIGTELLQRCCDANVKVLWIASDNQPDRYINCFKARGKRINLVMTTERNGTKFYDFLDKLLFRMFYGDTMPVAWSDICPPGSPQQDVPSSIFWAGRGAVKLR